MAWFNLTPVAKVWLGAAVAEAALNGINRASEPAPRKSQSQRRAMAKMILNSPWAVGKSDEELVDFCREITDEQFEEMFGEIPRG